MRRLCLAVAIVLFASSLNADVVRTPLTRALANALYCQLTGCTMTGLVTPNGNVFRVTADFTDASSTALQNITGLSWVLPANTAANYPFRCEIMYSQATAVVSDGFGIQSVNLAPTNIAAKGDIAISASATTYDSLPTLSTTTATPIATFTPAAIGMRNNARLAGLIENPSGVATTINIMVSQSVAGNLITIKRGSYCVVGF